MDSQATEITAPQKQLAAKSVELLQLPAKHVELKDMLSRVKVQNAAGATVSDDVESVAGAYERPAKRARMTRQCEDSSTTSSTTTLLALLVEWDDFREHCEALPLGNQCLPGLATEAKELREKMANLGKADAAAKSTSKCRGKKRNLAFSERVLVLEAELTDAKDCACVIG